MWTRTRTRTAGVGQLAMKQRAFFRSNWTKVWIFRLLWPRARIAQRSRGSILLLDRMIFHIYPQRNHCERPRDLQCRTTYWDKMERLHKEQEKHATQSAYLLASFESCVPSISFSVRSPTSHGNEQCCSYLTFLFSNANDALSRVLEDPRQALTDRDRMKVIC